MDVVTLNARHDIYGNRLNLVINRDTKEYYFTGVNAFNIGVVKENLPIREVEFEEKYLKEQGYVRVQHADVRGWAKQLQEEVLK